MGSLIAGWDSPIMDDEHTALFRNKSQTKEEIKTFWRSKSQIENNESDMHLSPYGSSVDSPRFLNDTETTRAAKTFAHSQNDKIDESTDEIDEITPKSDKSGDWWTRSNWAFLNEPPHDEMQGRAPNYTAQFNSARLDTGNA